MLSRARDSNRSVRCFLTLAATGGITPYSWSIVSGSLPTGLSLDSGTGEISGTPTAYGTSNFTVEVTDSQLPPDSDQQALSIEVVPEDLVITTASLPYGEVGKPYSQTLAATGGATPYSWAPPRTSESWTTLTSNASSSTSKARLADVRTRFRQGALQGSFSVAPIRSSFNSAKG